jgi:hypothetical protein
MLHDRELVFSGHHKARFCLKVAARRFIRSINFDVIGAR